MLLLRCGETILAGSTGGAMGGPGMHPSGGKEPPEFPEGMTPPEGSPPFDGAQPPELFQQYDGTQPPERPEAPEFGERPDGPGRPDSGGAQMRGETSIDFVIHDGGNMFANIVPAVVS